MAERHEESNSSLNESKTTEMDGQIIDYDAVDRIDKQSEKERLKLAQNQPPINQKDKIAIKAETEQTTESRSFFKLSPLGMKLAYVSNLSSVVVDEFEGSKYRSFNKPIQLSSTHQGVTSLQFKPNQMSSHDEILSVCDYSGQVFHYNVNSMNQVGTYVSQENEMFTDIAYSPASESMAVGCKSGEIYTVDCETLKASKLTRDARHGNRVQCLHWGNDGLYSIGWDNVLYKWDTRMMEPVFGQLCPCPTKSAFHFEENYILVGLVQQENNIQFVDLRKNGEMIKSSTLRSKQSGEGLAENDFGCEVQILHQSKFDPKLFLAATSRNNTVKVLKVNGTNIDELYSFEDLPGEVTALETSNTSRKAFLAGKNFKTTLTLEI